jgi:xylan 1,4-beta-xylosidase
MLLPFLSGATSEDYEGKMAAKAAVASFRNWTMIPASQMSRRLTPAVDEFHGGDLTLRVTSPRFPMREAPVAGEPASAELPALLVEMEVDNTASDQTATGFLGIAYRGKGRLRPLDWADSSLVGIGFQDRWALAAIAAKDLFTIRSGGAAPFVETGTPAIHPGGNEGGIAIRVPPHEKRTLTAVLSFYRNGNDVAQGRPSTRYAYTERYPSVESVCHAALDQPGAIREAASRFERELGPEGSDQLIIELLAQASQAYYANSSLLLDRKGAPIWSICEGQFGWRNTLDLAVDHLPYELRLHPWVARNVIDGFIDGYSYHDTVRYKGEALATRPGGISFTHDQGNYTAYSPPGRSGYEQPDRTGVYSFMTTEQLLNGAFCASACALRGGDASWAAARLPIACEILSSMEAREEKRDGLLSAQSDRVGKGSEITTYDALDDSLKETRGSLYIAVKTWAAALMLERWFDAEGSEELARRAHSLADRTAATLTHSFRADKGAFPPNLLGPGDALVVAALDPIAVPLFCGLGEGMRKNYPELVDRLRQHARTCMVPGQCLDTATGGMRLTSSTEKTWPSKVALTLSVISWLEQKPSPNLLPTILPELASWLQISAAKTTISDQINTATRKQIGGAYYPRLVTLAALIPPLQASTAAPQSKP